MEQIKLTIESRLSATPILGRIVNAISTDAGLLRGEAAMVEVAVIEAVNNAIEHAYRGEPTHLVEVEVQVSADTLAFEVCDSGASADPASVHANHQKAFDIRAETYSTASERGRGLAIIQRVMDFAEYLPGKERNRFRLMKCLPTSRSRTDAAGSGREHS